MLGAAAADPSAVVRDEIQAEAQLQRTALQDLRNVLERRGELALLLALGFRARAAAGLVVFAAGAGWVARRSR